ncbi:unnamed protein product [Phaedon cochleariae]|uniref:Uncharacterized protein n=1 Tax=Phaedon cochleariae TaxID=80249 RepID=A0A9N9SFE9_PHACE|nr:unnamed protein product [Phaedon cochleariae]
MSEFELHDIVTALLSTLGGKVTPNKLVEYLQERQSRNTAGCSIIIQKHLTRLSQDISDPDTFLAKYNDLKDKNVDSLNSYVELLDLISQDHSLKDFILRSTKPTSCSKAELTKDDLPQVIYNIH